MKDAIRDPGPQTIAISQGTGRGYNRYTMRMARSLGTGNAITPGYVCHSPRLGLYALVTGYGRLYCDYHGWGGEFPKTQIMWAKQLEISSADSEMCYWFMNSLDYCKNLIIIDPRATRVCLAGQPLDPAPARHRLRPGPGHDERHHRGGALGQGVRRELDVRLRRAARAGQGLHPGEGLRHLLDPQGARHEAARMWAIDTPGCIQVGSSLERQANCGHTLRAITCLMGLTGNIERPGQHDQLGAPRDRPDRGLQPRVAHHRRDEAQDHRRRPVSRWAPPAPAIPTPWSRASTPARARSRCGSASAGSRSCIWPTPKRSSTAIEKVEFMSHTDLFMGPMAEAADIVLPAAHWLELDDVYDMHPALHDRGPQQGHRPARRSQVRRLDLQRGRQARGARQVVRGRRRHARLPDPAGQEQGRRPAQVERLQREAGQRLLGPRPGVLQVQDRLLERGRRLPHDPEQEVRVPLEPPRVAGIRPAAGVHRARGKPGLHAGALQGIPAAS